MTGPAPREEPPLLADPRRWGGVAGLVGGITFVAGYSPALGPAASTLAWLAGGLLTGMALFALFVRKVPLGESVRPRPLALATYCGCVVGELVLIGAGSRFLAASGRDELRLALVVVVVGLHFVPFAWAFRERMFLRLGACLTVLGAAGLLAGALGVPRAAEATAVVAGLTMPALITLYALGRFRPAAPTPPG